MSPVTSAWNIFIILIKYTNGVSKSECMNRWVSGSWGLCLGVCVGEWLYVYLRAFVCAAECVYVLCLKVCVCVSRLKCVCAYSRKLVGGFACVFVSVVIYVCARWPVVWGRAGGTARAGGARRRGGARARAAPRAAPARAPGLANERKALLKLLLIDVSTNKIIEHRNDNRCFDYMYFRNKKKIFFTHCIPHIAIKAEGI